MNLQQNGFVFAFEPSAGPWSGNSVPYREDPHQDPMGFTDYLRDKWLGRGWVKVSHGLREAVAGKVFEVYDNAFAHSQSSVGVISCGQYFKNIKILRLCMVDFGLGIPGKVRTYLEREHYPDTGNLTDGHCLAWAFEPGNTTSAELGGRGMGLDILRDFVSVNSVNNGRLEMFSGRGYAIFGAQEKKYMNLPSGFQGTAVTISLRCDPRYYLLKSETSPGPLF
jgi:hypothetical protein